jgi:hypothetical protein
MIIKSYGMKCAGHLASMEEMKNGYIVYLRISNNVNKIGLTIEIAIVVFIAVSENVILILIIMTEKVICEGEGANLSSPEGGI